MANLDQLDTDEFMDLVADVGETPLRYRRYLGPCPNCQPARGGFAPTVDCPVCAGGSGIGPGVIYEDYTAPEDSQSAGKVILQNANAGRTMGGIKILAGDASCTFLSTDYPMVEGDRLYFQSRIHTRSVLLERGSGDSDRLGPLDTALEIVALYLPTGRLETDWSLSDDGMSVVWTGSGESPDAGTSYTVTYRFYLAWEVPSGTTYHRIRAEDLTTPFPDRIALRPFLGLDPDRSGSNPF